jgi:type I restriction-modification system DNA methylase subunit
MEKKESLEIVKRLVQQFDGSRREFISPASGYSEPRLRNDFLDPFLEALGWDVNNKKGVSQFLREVIIEDTVEVEEEEVSLRKKPDYALCAAGERKFFLEAKKPAVPILTASKPAFQLRRYGWNAKVPISVLSNFDKLIIYDCRHRPRPEDNSRVGRVKSYSYTEYVEKFDEIYNQLSWESVYSGKFDDLFAADEEISGTEPFDQYFLQQIEKWRGWLAQNIFQLNQRLTNEEINFLTQRLLNRIIFLRICEDREIEKYKALKSVATYDDLKKLFQEADKRYNSALFDFIEDQLSLEIRIDGNVLINIFQELYYPQSPYAFSVVEANVLGQIYEQFLASEIRIGDNGNINIVQKPEVVAANGVVPTPQYIVENIIKKTSTPLREGKSPNQLTNFRVADIDCGSGIFLLTAYEDLLNYHLEWYLNDGHLKHQDKLHSIKTNRWQLTLSEKQRILLNNIWGVDIDPQAVEVTRFSLLLKVIEGETSATIEAHFGKYHQKALPNLNKNIQCGNSLIDNSYFIYDPSATTSEQVFNIIKPFNWKDHFPAVMKEGGFDVIVGNPPYIRIQNMVHYSPQEIRYYQSSASPFSCAKNNNFDKYSLFIERALTLLKPRGRLGYILPHKFFKIKSGEALRKHISSNQYLCEVVYFGVQQVFGKARSTYTCILVLCRESSKSFSVEHVNKLGAWRYGAPGTIDRYSAEDIDEKPWIFVHPKVRVIFDRIKKEHKTLLKDVANIFVGVQTSADKIYILRSVEETPNSITFNDQTGALRTIEREILRPCLLDVKLTSFGKPKANSYIIFPYKIVREQAILYSKSEMSKKFPLCWKYLNSHKEKLSQRNMPNRTNENWYQYGRSQSLTKFNGEEKLVWPVLSLEPKYVYDEDNIVITGGGNGPYYALRLRQPTLLSLFYIQAILFHPIIEAMVQAGASTFRGGYGSHGKQFIENLPICQIDFGNSKERKTLHTDIVKLVKQLIKTTILWTRSAVPDKKDALASQRVILIDQINQNVERLYGITPEDLQVLENFPVVAGESEEDLKQ